MVYNSKTFQLPYFVYLYGSSVSLWIKCISMEEVFLTEGNTQTTLGTSSLFNIKLTQPSLTVLVLLTGLDSL